MTEPPPYNAQPNLITWREDYGHGPTRPLPKGLARIIYEIRAILGRGV